MYALSLNPNNWALKLLDTILSDGSRILGYNILSLIMKNLAGNPNSLAFTILNKHNFRYSSNILAILSTRPDMYEPNKVKTARLVNRTCEYLV